MKTTLIAIIIIVGLVGAVSWLIINNRESENAQCMEAITALESDPSDTFNKLKYDLADCKGSKE